MAVTLAKQAAHAAGDTEHGQRSAAPQHAVCSSVISLGGHVREPPACVPALAPHFAIIDAKRESAVMKLMGQILIVWLTCGVHAWQLGLSQGYGADPQHACFTGCSCAGLHGWPNAAPPAPGAPGHAARIGGRACTKLRVTGFAALLHVRTCTCSCCTHAVLLQSAVAAAVSCAAFARPHVARALL
jgi:hypothetical protein|eukprot:COSAG01_NODE_5177_length_4431_cov_265.386657_2_plen_186_part_00